MLAAAVVHLAGPVIRRSRRTPSWSHALALLAVAVLGLRLLTLLDYLLQAPFAGRSTLLAFGTVEAVAVLAVGVPLARLAATALRRLPPVPPGSAWSTTLR